MPLDPEFLALQRAQLELELTDKLHVYIPFETRTATGERRIEYPSTPNSTVDCLVHGSGGSSQEKQIAAKVQAIIIQSVIIGAADFALVPAKARVKVQTDQGISQFYEVIAPPIPRSNGIGYRVVLGLV